MLKVGELFAVFKLDKNEYENQLKEAEASLNNFGKKIHSLGDKAIKGFGVALTGLGAASFKFGNEINASMANVQTLIPGNVERIKELKAEVQSLAIETAKGTTDIADGLYQVISAFGDSADTAKILEINAKAATAGVATTLDAINLTSAVTKGYGDTTATAVQKVSDLAFNAVKLGQTTFPELAASIGRVTPLTAELGVSMEELFGVMATATGVTGSAAEVSTQLRGVMQSLLAPTKDMFQSSPALNGRCNNLYCYPVYGTLEFQSSPALNGRCNFIFILGVIINWLFQSSPALNGRCNEKLEFDSLMEPKFQSSPALNGRCNGLHVRYLPQAPGFNPHRP